jgi:hypothetical protein
LARIAYCMLRDGRWQDKQVIPKWFVEETAAPTHAVKGAEMRFKRNAQSFSHGWELPARLRGEGGPSGEGLPADARYKPGSGAKWGLGAIACHLRIAFVSTGYWGMETNRFLRN